MGLMDFFKKGKEQPVKPPTAQAVSGKEDAAPRSYTIKSGDSLSKIAKQFYGNAQDWQKIYQANKDKIKNPDLIHPGQTIIIP